MKITCLWDAGPSMHCPPSNAAGTHELRLAASVLLGAAGGDMEKAIQLLRKLTAEREQLDCP